MNKYKKFICLMITSEIILILLCNVVCFYQNSSGAGRPYRVETKRVLSEIKEKNLSAEEIAAMDLSEYETIVRISRFLPGEDCLNDYVIEEINGSLYRFEYLANQNRGVSFFVNGILLAMLLVTSAVLFYVQNKVIKPFHDMSNLAYELAKGNLSIPVREEKSKLFGRFLWGMDMLREKLEDDKEKEMELQRERKTLILSLSHDIKTPLSSIEMYAKALAENLYDTPEKKEDALRGITRNAGDIKKYVNEIVTAVREDFLNLEVIPGEFYFSEVLNEIKSYYKEKLSVVHTEFVVEDIPECLIRGDKNRLIEVLQNIMENAMKYGDGTCIRIYGGDEEDCRLIHIENTGSSLKEEELPNLFDSFYRGGNSHGIKGNGLGLYICKTLMRKMDGDVFVQMCGDKFTVSVVIRRA